MRNEELGTWLNGFPNPNANALNNLPRGHLASQPSSGFPLYAENNIVNDADVNVDVDVLLSNDFSRMSVFHEQGNANVGARTRGYGYGVMDSSYTHAFPHSHSHAPCSFNAHAHVREETLTGAPSSTWGGVTVSSDVKGHTFAPPMERSACYGHVQLQNPFHASPYDKRRPFAVDCDVKSPFMYSQTMMQPPPPPQHQQQPKLAFNVNTPSSHYFPAARERATRVIVPPNGEFSHSRGDPVAFQRDSGFVMQEKDMKYCVGRECNSLWGCKESLPLPVQAVGEEVPQLISSSHAAPARHEKNSILASDVSLPPRPLFNFGPLVKFQGYIYHLAKDQNGCRFLQRMVDEGASEDTQIVFNGVIDDVVELMMDPFGNYLVQKLIDVCGEDQRLQIVSMLTKEPGLLVKTSLNTHGTRVVQKLIATVNSRKQIALLRSSIQPGFLDLIKDLNGNHVIQRCLQYFSCKDNEFIFDAATKFCVDIATHQHGCCVLQRCIDYSTGKYQDKLVKEICRHGLILAQDPFGNYVVQYIIEMENPSASSKLHSQFKGNYVNLSMQKFSSHVVEKCLVHVAESRSRIVQELLSFSHFERLLPDPYANYVVQRALGVTKGSLHASLVEAVRPHKILRTSPYCKRIFSRNLLN
ncbi:putative pumilio-like 7, chloroplastic, partial [Mucuna pruriens]